MRKVAMGVDLGGTKIAVAFVDDSGKIVHNLSYPTDVNQGPEGAIAQIVVALRDLKEITGLTPEAIGIGLAGQVDSSRGIVHFAPNLFWHEVGFSAMLQRAIALPIRITNDVRAATFGEWLFGAGKGAKNLVCLFVGTGIGGGLVIEGQLINGSSNTAGELGHTIIDKEGPRCSCGNHGCLEALASGWALARDGQNSAKADPEKAALLLELSNGNIEAITAKTIARAYHMGDPLAIQIVKSALAALTAGAISIVHAFNPERLVLGGGIIHGFPEWVAAVQQGVQEKALKAATKYLQVLPGKLKEADAGVIGAALFTLKAT